MTFVLLQLLLRHGKGFFADHRNRDLDPIGSRPLVVGTVAARQPPAFPQCSRDALSRPEFGLPIAGPAPVGRVAQHPPNRGSLPASRPRSSRNLLLVQQPGNGTDAEPLLRVHLIHPTHHSRLRFDDFVIGGGSVALPHITVTVRGARQYVDRSLAGPVTFAPARALGNCAR